MLFLLSLSACDSMNRTPIPHNSPEISIDSNYSDAAKLRKDFMSNEFLFSFIISPPTVNTYSTIHYDNKFPKAAAFGNYRQENDNQKDFDCLLAVNFDWPFEKNLPKSILDELKKHNLTNKKLIDIFWVMQPLSSLSNITYLKAHGWADPDEPIEYNNIRVDRNFLYGLYEADINIGVSYGVELYKLKPFHVYVHHGKYSPKTAAVSIPDNPASMALWSLVIDNNNPNKNIKALATLHWLVSDEDFQKIKQESYERKNIIDKNGIDLNKEIPKYKNIGEYIDFFKNQSFLKDTSLVKKLSQLSNIE